MKSIINIFLYVFLFAALIFSTFAADGYEYRFDIEIENDFFEDEEIECQLDYDDRDDDFSLDDRDSTYDVDHDFTEDVELDCNKVLDKITFTVEDSEGIIMFQKIYLNAFGVDYDVISYDDTKQYFLIDLTEHDFDLTGPIDCDLDIDDERSYTYDVDDDTDREDLEIRRNFDERLEFMCDEQFEEIRFEVFDETGDVIFSETYDNENNFDYDIRGLNKNYFEIEIDHDIGNNTIECDLRIDDEETEEYIFDEDTETDDYDIEKRFIEDIEFDCNDDLDLIELTVYDSEYDLIDVIEYENEDGFDYEFNQGDYEFFLELTHEFRDSDDEIDCDLDIDDDDRIDFTYDDSSSLSDLRVEDAFEQEFQFDCDDEIDEFFLIIFEDIEGSNNDREVLRKTYTNTDRIDFDIDNLPTADIEVEDVGDVEPEVEEEVEEEPEVEEESREDKMPILANPTSPDEFNDNSDTENNETEIDSTGTPTDVTWFVVGAGAGVAVLFVVVLLALI